MRLSAKVIISYANGGQVRYDSTLDGLEMSVAEAIKRLDPWQAPRAYGWTRDLGQYNAI